MRNIFNGHNALFELNELVKTGTFSSVFFLTDSNTNAHCLPLVLENMPDLQTFEILEIDPGEINKTVEIAANLWLAMAELGADRNSLLINVGGGVVTDLGAFVAATFMRGISFVHVPTSLLAMVDAAHGGKTGIDVGGIKNLAGTFSLPLATAIWPPFLQTLPQNQLKSGLAEVLKHGLIADASYFKFAIESWQQSKVELCIGRSVDIKNAIVAQDETEQGIRKVLNFGHTLGHALESFFLHQLSPILHGEAVAAGMQLALFLSVKNAGFCQAEADELCAKIDAIFSPLKWKESDVPQILNWLKHDKKNLKNATRFVLLAAAGVPKIDVEIVESEAKEALDWYKKKHE